MEYAPANTNPYRYWIAFVMKGVKNARRKFHIQFEPAASEAWYDRVRVGNVSPVRIHTPGAHVVAYPRMNKHAETIITEEGYVRKAVR